MSQAKSIEQLQCRVDRLMGQIENLAAELAAVKVELASHERDEFTFDDDTLVNILSRLTARDAASFARTCRQSAAAAPNGHDAMMGQGWDWDGTGMGPG